jgi:hypothetical protein
MRLTKLETEQFEKEMNRTFYNCFLKFAVVVCAVCLIGILILTL